MDVVKCNAEHVVGKSRKVTKNGWFEEMPRLAATFCRAPEHLAECSTCPKYVSIQKCVDLRELVFC